MIRTRAWSKNSMWRGRASKSATVSFASQRGKLACASVALIILILLSLSASASFVRARVVLSQERVARPERSEQDGDRAGRLRPPASLKCDRNQLTSYSGVVTSFRQLRGRTTISLRTDWDSTETFTLRHARRNRTPYELMLLRAEPFTQQDRAEVFTSNGRIKPNMRVNVWVCEDGTNPVIDWQPSNGSTTSTP